MPRETKLERLERENRDLREEVNSCRAWAERESAEARRLGERCNFLYKQATTFGTELIRLCLHGPEE